MGGVVTDGVPGRPSSEQRLSGQSKQGWGAGGKVARVWGWGRTELGSHLIATYWLSTADLSPFCRCGN